jgi:hypothetical protein
MIIGVIPADSKTASGVIQGLITKGTTANSPFKIKAWYRDASRAPSQFVSQSNFEASEGNVLDESSFDLLECDVVLTVLAPAFTNSPMRASIEKGSFNIKAAIEKAGSVKRLVILSSDGPRGYEAVVSSCLRTSQHRRLTLMKLSRARQKRRQLRSEYYRMPMFQR